MATKPGLVWQKQGSPNSMDQWVSESWTGGELGATGRHAPPLAPKAEPEEDIDLEPGAQEETLQEKVSKIKMADTTKMEHEEPTGMSQHTPRETQETAAELEQASTKLSEELQAHEESEESLNLVGDTFQLPSPLSASPAEECPEKEVLSSLEEEPSECISDDEIISDASEELTSSESQNRQECTQAPQFTEPADRDVESTSEETAGDSVKMAEEVARLNSLLGGLDNSEPEYIFQGVAAKTNQPTIHPPMDKDNSIDLFAIDSPPFADEVEEEEDVSVQSSPMDIYSCQKQGVTLGSNSKPLQSSRNSSTSSELDPAAAQPAVPLGKQQGEQLSQCQCELAPRGANQETAQQVHSQSSPPLSTVAMELANQGASSSQGSACAVAARERNRRAGERTGGGRRQTGGEKGQKESRFDTVKTFGEKHTGGVLKYSNIVQKQGQRTEIYNSVSSKHSRVTRMESDSYDDSQSDSGVSADLSPCNTLQSHTNIPTGKPTRTNETPIEREIRRSIEREYSLRRSRGLQNPPISPEYVEIPLRKSVLSQSLPAKSERSQDKDKQFAGKKMQQEIHTEAQREQALVKLGKVPGVYDKGTVRQLKERKQIFEAFQEPKDSFLTISNRSKTPSWVSASEVSTMENHEDLSSPASTLGGSFVGRRRSADQAQSQAQNSTSGSAREGGPACTSPRGPCFSEGTGCQVIIRENTLNLPAQTPFPSKSLNSASFPEAEALTVVDSGTLCASPSRIRGCGGITERGEQMAEEEEEEEAVPKENPFFKLRSSNVLVKVEQDIREARERERELRKQRSSLYGGTGVTRGRGGGVQEGRGGGRPASLERPSLTLPPPPLNGLATPDFPASLSKGATEPPPARQSLGKLGMWPPAQAEEEISRPEVLQSPRTPRQKTPLLQRWESGLVNGHGEEDD